MASARKIADKIAMIFKGEITAKPSTVSSPKSAGKRVRKHEGAISVVPADQVPEGVRVMIIDGKKPGDAGYPLIAPKKKTDEKKAKP